MKSPRLYDHDVFISYAREDEAAVLRIYELLSSEGFAVWFDRKRISGGQDWEKEIQDAIEECQVFMPVVSAGSRQKRGFVQAEIRIAERVLATIPDDDVYVLPVRLDECDLPSSFSKYQRVDLFAEGGERFLVKSLHLALSHRHRLSPFGRCVQLAVESFRSWGGLKLHSASDLRGDIGSRARMSFEIPESEPLVAAVSVPNRGGVEHSALVVFGNTHLYALMKSDPGANPVPSGMPYLEFARRDILFDRTHVSLATGDYLTTKLIPMPDVGKDTPSSVVLSRLLSDTMKFIRVGMTFRGLDHESYFPLKANGRVEAD